MAKRTDKPVDARDAVAETFGSPNRDAAVDPRPIDYLPPTNAGKADPHGPLVVAPGIHAVGPAPIRPGNVHVDDPAQQAKEETSLAQSVLVDREPATDIAVEFNADKNMGPLGLSDPGSVEQGKNPDTTTDTEPTTTAAATNTKKPAAAKEKSK